jgi:hypothetical protein
VRDNGKSPAHNFKQMLRAHTLFANNVAALILCNGSVGIQ